MSTKLKNPDASTLLAQRNVYSRVYRYFVSLPRRGRVRTVETLDTLARGHFNLLRAPLTRVRISWRIFVGASLASLSHDQRISQPRILERFKSLNFRLAGLLEYSAARPSYALAFLRSRVRDLLLPCSIAESFLLFSCRDELPRDGRGAYGASGAFRLSI